MRLFAETYNTIEIVQTLSGQLPWSHNLYLIQKVKTQNARIWYIQQAVQNGWSYRMLVSKVKDKTYEHEGINKRKTTNFQLKLPNPQSNLAEETIKDPYRFHFINMGKDAREQEVQRGLIAHINQFLLALGQGFAFYASNYTFNLSNKTYEIDLLMYHTKLHCYTVIELKRGEFQPKDAGQLNFYLSAIDDLLKTPHDNPTIGILLCEKKDHIIAEYALRDLNKPIGISQYELSKSLPEEIQGVLPSIEEIEAELNAEFPKKALRKTKK